MGACAFLHVAYSHRTIRKGKKGVNALLGNLFNTTAMNAMGRGMEAANLRHAVLSNNIANVNTPYFKRSDVAFEDLLAKELSLDDEKQLPLVRTNRLHLPMPSNGPVRGQIIADDSTSMRYDQNNVDIDREMAEVAKNNMYFNALARQMGNQFTILRASVSGQ